MELNKIANFGKGFFSGLVLGFLGYFALSAAIYQDLDRFSLVSALTTSFSLAILIGILFVFFSDKVFSDNKENTRANSIIIHSFLIVFNIGQFVFLNFYADPIPSDVALIVNICVFIRFWLLTKKVTFPMLVNITISLITFGFGYFHN